MGGQERLLRLKERVKTCKKCDLWKGRINAVFGVGNSDTELLFCGEAPGYYEDLQGEPFVGAAGKLLDKLLASIGLTRGDVYIGNLLKCRPPGNRDPLPSEIETCKPYLFEQIDIIKPKIISTLGAFATKLILNKNVSMAKVHGKVFPAKKFYVFPIYHPAAALHNPSVLAALEEDFLALKNFLNKEIAPLKEQIQMDLF